MNPFKTFLVLSIASTMLHSVAVAADLNDEDAKTFNGLLATNAALLQDAGKQIDLIQIFVTKSYENGVYGRTKETLQVKQSQEDEGRKLKESIASLIKEVQTAQPDVRDSAKMILLLSKEQTMSFLIYRWAWHEISLADLANAYSGKRDEEAGKFFAEFEKEHENVQDLTASIIQAIATNNLNK
jgi:hypothetical protein